MWTQFSDFLVPLTSLLAVILGYVLGRRQTEHERLYERRAEVIAGLFERYEQADKRLHSLVNPIDLGGEPAKPEKAHLAAESFNELLSYHRTNSIWLSRHTARQVQDFIEQYRATYTDFTKMQSRERHGLPADPKVPDWLEIWQAFNKKSPAIRIALEEEFRAALGDQRAKWARRWQSVIGGLRSSNRSGPVPELEEAKNTASDPE